jgi:protein kinase A
MIIKQMDQRAQQRLKKNLAEWSVIKTIGVGLFGKVRLAQHKKNETYRAIKVLQKKQIMDLQQVEHIYNEYTIMKDLNHPFIVRDSLYL